LADPDLWGYLNFGRVFWQNGFPWSDTFSYLPTKPEWIYHEWLTGVIFYKIYKVFDFAGLQFFKYLLGFTTAFIILHVAKRNGASISLSLMGLFLISPLFSLSYSPFITQIFSHLFSAYLFYRVVTDKQKFSFIGFAVFFLIGSLWVNLHGGLVAGIGFAFLWLLGNILQSQKFHNALGSILALLAGSFMNPYGYHYWQGIFDEIVVPRPDIPEWWSIFKSLNSNEHFGSTVHLGVLILVAFIGILVAKEKRLDKILILFFSALLASLHIRHESLFLIAFACFVPVMFEASVLKLKIQLRISGTAINILKFAILSLSLFVAIPILNRNILNLDQEKNYPTQALRYLREQQFSGNILTELDWGSYITWQLSNSSKVGIDGRYATVFGAEVLEEYFDFLYARQGAADFILKYPHQIAILRSETLGSDILKNSTKWKMVYHDSEARVYLTHDMVEDSVQKNIIKDNKAR